MSTSYVPLWCKSNLSFLEGASHPEELVEEAQRLGLDALALCDRDGVYGIVQAHLAARERGVALIVGSEITLDDGATVVLLAQDRAGYAQLCQLITRGRRRSPKGKSSVAWSEVCEHASGLIALCSGENGLLARERDPSPQIGALADAFGDRLYALLARHRRADEVALEARIVERATRFDLPLVASCEVLYHASERKRLQDIVTCIRHGVTLSTAGRRLKPNAEHALLSPHAFEQLFADQPAAVARTREVAARCTFSMAELRYRYPSERRPDGTTSSQWLHQLTFEGARRRYGARLPADVQKQIEKELALVDELDYCGYFLTMRDLVEFCQRENILCQGRGSAANSAVCYCLEITAVDPVRMGLLFERFLSRERAEPPDIDLDIEHERREEVIQHVYKKYGRTHAAMVANLICYRGRSALREVGKALGFPETALARIASMVSHYDSLDEDSLRDAGLDPRARESRLLFELASAIEGFPRHLSIHPGGFLLGHEPIATLVPVENATMDERTVIQWNKDDVEALGLFKVDLLGLGALTHLHRCFDLLARHRGALQSLATIPPDDSPTYDQIGRGDTVGVFQIESRAQMAMLPRLLPRTYYDLVIEVSIVRPGPITGGMVHPYLRRRNGEEQVEYPHECLRPVLEKTLGVPLFQEQVMRLAVVAADYTPGEADQLRRDMAAWKKVGSIERHRERLLVRMQKKGIAAEFAERVFAQIRGFGEYGFPESHAASFALISYAGAWLKCHYPAEFTCSLLNAQPMGFYSIATIVEDAKRHQVELRPIDARASGWDCSLEPAGADFAVRMGLRCVKGLRRESARAIEAAASHAAFESLDDFVRRTRLSRGELAALAEAGAFDSFADARRSALWDVHGLTTADTASMFNTDERAVAFAPLSLFDTIDWDYAASSHSARGHPLGPLRAELTALGLPDARTVHAMQDRRRVRYAGIVICRQRPGTASGIVFMTLEDETGFVNVILRPNVFERFRVLGRTLSFLGVTGRLQAHGEVVHVLAERLWKPKVTAPPPSTQSHDFH